MPKILKRSDIVEYKSGMIPSYIFEAFNDLIAKNFDGTQSVIKQEEAVNYIIKKARESGIVLNKVLMFEEKVKEFKENLFSKRFLDIEPYYRKEGWQVTFEKPAYCENFEPYWTFK